MAVKPVQLSAFAEFLVKLGLLAAAQARDLSEQARAEEMPFILFLETNKWVEGKKLAEAVATFHKLPLYDLDAHQASKIPVEFITAKEVQKDLAIPLLRRKNILFLGVFDPEHINVSETSFSMGVQIKLVVVEVKKLKMLVADMREAQMVAGLEKRVETKLSAKAPTESLSTTLSKFSIANTDDKPIVSFINQVITDAIKIKASDIHFEPFENFFRIRYRIDGVLHEVAKSPISAASPIISRLKVLSDLDIAEHRVPQDGRFKMTLAMNKSIDFRVSTCPTIYGEKIVMRVLDPEVMPLDIAALGMDAHQTEIYLRAVNQPQGIILVTGPTGSGKTVSLYTALKLLNSIQKNICTVEDPIEIYLPGVNQVHMNAKTGLTFAKAMRAFLRQDPDIIMVGEIRDLETADIAIKASQTGHLVLSTLHTNDAPTAIARLMNLGLAPYNIASTLTLVIAQRLARKLCKYCKKPANYARDVLLETGFDEKEIPNLQLFEPGQCEKCNNGFKGREGIYEMMLVSREMRNIIADGGNLEKLTNQALKEGMVTLRRSGLNKVKLGVTTIDEVNRIVAEGY